MRSVNVVLPESIWALIPIFLTFDKSLLMATVLYNVANRQPAGSAFKKIYYDDSSKQEINLEEYTNTYVKLVVENKTDFYAFEKLVESLYNANVLDLKIIETMVEKDKKDVDINLEITDTLSLLNEYIDEVEMSVNKNDLKSVMRSLYIESCEVV